METVEMKKFLMSFSDSIDAENIELYKRVIDSGKIGRFDGPDQFFYAVLYTWENFIEGYIKSEISTNEDVLFIYQNSQFIDRHFTNLFEKIEGPACSSDKSRTIIRGLVSFFGDGQKIKFNYDSKYTYHLPKKIFKTHNEILKFYNGLKKLIYGHGEEYAKALHESLNF